MIIANALGALNIEQSGCIVLIVEIRYERARLMSKCEHEARKMVYIADANSIALIAGDSRRCLIACSLLDLSPKASDRQRLELSCDGPLFTGRTRVGLQAARGSIQWLR
jgi:hypothetical protein